MKKIEKMALHSETYLASNVGLTWNILDWQEEEKDESSQLLFPWMKYDSLIV